MSRVVRVNVHPRPCSTDWDFNIPYHGNSYNQAEHVHDSYLKTFLDQIPTASHVILINDGEPVSRQIAVKKIISQAYDNIIIDSKNARYHQQDPIFKKPWMVEKRSSDFNDQEIVNYYLENYQQLTLFSSRYQYQHHSRDHGYFQAVRRYWYHWGADMPKAPDACHEIIYEMFRQLFETTVQYLCGLPLDMSAHRIRQNLMFRLNHNPPGSEINDHLVPRHADNSVITLWLHQSHPGSFIDFGQDESKGIIPLNELHDARTEFVVFPGFDYCDQLNTMTPATWHGVINHDDVDRVSLVAFLKY